jgi:predicted transposase YdaD
VPPMRYLLAVSRSESPEEGTSRRRKGANSEHDHGYKLLLSHPHLVEELIRGFLPRHWADRLDFSTLERVSGSFVSDDFRERHDDVIWKLRWRREKESWFWIYLLVELQSKPDRWMAVRLLTYVGLLLQELIRQGKLEPGRKLPAVLPIVFYNGKPQWRSPRDLASLFVTVPPDIRRYLPRLHYLLLDENRLPLDRPELRDNLMAALLQVEASQPREALSRAKEVLRQTPDGESGLRRILRIWLGWLFQRFFPGGIIPEEVDLEDFPMLEQTFRDWERQIRREERQEGEIRGMQKLVLSILRQRFGPVPQVARQRVKEVSSTRELDELSRRILSADSLQQTGLV